MRAAALARTALIAMLFAVFTASIAFPAAPASEGAAAQQRGQRGRPGQSLEEAMRIPEQEAQPQLFGARVTRVRVDVIVTDGDGDFVADLGPEDFTVYEDGERQEILDVQLIDLAEGQIHPLMHDDPGVAVSTEEAVSRRGPAAAPVVEGGEIVEPAPAPASELGAIIFLIDGPSLSPQARARFGDAWMGLLEQTDSPRVPRAAYMVDSVGMLDELVPLGYDGDALREAAEAVRAAPVFGTNLNQRMYEVVTDLSDPNLGEFAEQIAAQKARSFEAAERTRTLATYKLLTNFADALWTRSGRTALVWVSTGIKLMQGGPFDAVLGNEMSVFSPDPQVAAAQERLHHAANASNVSIYAIDPTLLQETRNAGVDVELARSGAVIQSPLVQQSIDGLRDSMRMAAAETGGKAFIQATDIEMVLSEIEADTSRFYLLTYEPPSIDGDGAYHEIRVEVAFDDVDVRARSGYVDQAPDDRVRRLIAAGLALPGAVTDLPVEAQVFRSRPTGGGPNVLLAIAVDGAEVGLMMSPDGDQRVSVDMHSLVLDGTTIVDEAHEQLSARSTADGGLESTDSNPLTPTLLGYLAYQHEWSLAPGDYTFNVAVVDNVTGRVGATSVDLEIPVLRAADAWGTSDPLLVTIDEAGRVHPVVLGRFVPGDNVVAFVEVYGGQRPILSGQVLAASAADDENPQGARLFPLAMRPAGVGVHHGMIPLPAGMPAGEYLVQLVITDPPADEHRIVRLPIEVVAPPGR